MYKIKYIVFGEVIDICQMICGMVVEGPKGGAYFMDFSTARNCLIATGKFNIDEIKQFQYYGYEKFDELAKKLKNRKDIASYEGMDTFKRLKKDIPGIKEVLLNSRQYNMIVKNLIL